MPKLMSLRDPQPVVEDGGGGVETDVALALSLTGPLSGGTVSGEAKVIGAPIVGFSRSQLNDWLVGDRGCEMPPVFALDREPWKAWRFDIHGTAEKVGLGSQMMSANVRLTGTGATPALVGLVSFASAGNHDPLQTLTLRQATLDFREGFGTNPVVTAEAAGHVALEPFALCVTGTLQNPMRVFICHPPLTEKVVRVAINGEAAAKFFAGGNRFSLLVPAELREEVEISDWAAIQAEPAGETETNPITPGSGSPQ